MGFQSIFLSLSEYVKRHSNYNFYQAFNAISYISSGAVDGLIGKLKENISHHENLTRKMFIIINLILTT